jgi:hypothetical protein
MRHRLGWSGFSPATVGSLLPDSLRGPRRYSLAFVVGAAATIALMPDNVFSGFQLSKTPVFATRAVGGHMQTREQSLRHELSLVSLHAPEEAASSQYVSLMMIDGNRDGRLVLFPHDFHVEVLAKAGDTMGQDACTMCHHLNMPFDRNTSCCECHRDMYINTDIFDHGSHVVKLGSNSGCGECHQDSAVAKTRDTARDCAECHEGMMASGSTIRAPKGGMRGFAVGYMDAMHGLCITCHQQRAQEEPVKYDPQFAGCACCHREVDGALLEQMGPYAINRGGSPEVAVNTMKSR